MRIAVVGAGGVGGWLAARLWAAGVDVHVLARGAHLAVIMAEGLLLTSPAGDVRAAVDASDVAEEIGPCDFVLFCVKTYDTAAAATSLPALCGEQAVVASLQNGIDNVGQLARVVGRARMVGGLAQIASVVAEPGVVVHSGGPARVVFSDLAGSVEGRAGQLVAACSVPGVNAQIRRVDRGGAVGQVRVPVRARRDHGDGPAAAG